MSNKISKKYIGTDQVGSVQIELENALSLRAKQADGLASIDLLEFSADDELLVQQDMFLADAKALISKMAFASDFEIRTENSANIVVITEGPAAGASGEVQVRSGQSLDGNSGAITLASGEADQNSGNIYLTTGLANNYRGEIISTASVFDVVSPTMNMKPFAGGICSFSIYDNTLAKYLKLYQQGLDFQIESSEVLRIQSKDLNEVTPTQAVYLESGANDDTGGSGSVYVQSGNCPTGVSGNIVIKSGTANNTGNRGIVELDGSYVQMDVPMGNTVQMNFESESYNTQFNLLATAFGESNRSGALQFNSGGTVNSFAIFGTSAADVTPGPVQMIGATLFKTADGAATSGGVSLKTDTSLNLVIAANAEVSSGAINLNTGNASVKGTGANASSGDINLATGSKIGTGTRGKISLDADHVDCNAMLIREVADPVAAQDAATKAYVDAQIAAGTDFHKEIITLDGTDITNQYVDLEFECLPQSVQIGVGQRVNLYEGSDFSVSVDGGTGGVARVTFTGPSATGGAEALVAGDILYISFVKA